MQDDIDESVEKYLDRNRMNTANLFHYLLQKGYREIFPNVMTLLELAAICPTTTAEAEHEFSLMNLLCTPLRSSMLPKTLEYLTRICLAHDPTEDEWNDLVETFIVGSEFVKTTRRLGFEKK